MEDSRSHSAAVPLNFQVLRLDLSINLLNLHDSVPVLLVICLGGFSAASLDDADVCLFFSELCDSGLLNEPKTISLMKQMYSNSLQSRSIQTPKSAVASTSLVYKCKLFGEHKKLGACFLSTCNRFFLFVFVFFVHR